PTSSPSASDSSVCRYQPTPPTRYGATMLRQGKTSSDAWMGFSRTRTAASSVVIDRQSAARSMAVLLDIASRSTPPLYRSRSAASPTEGSGLTNDNLGPMATACAAASAGMPSTTRVRRRTNERARYMRRASGEYRRQGRGTLLLQRPGSHSGLDRKQEAIPCDERWAARCAPQNSARLHPLLPIEPGAVRPFRCLRQHLDDDAAVLRAAIAGVVRRDRLLFAEADHVHLVQRHLVLLVQVALHLLGTLLTELQVV